ncbi:MAG: energy transducer TonB [Erythrobacter sp.]|uniref:energy transducer TonB n=1 Tax=Erythrobacter sp. TaxID=1042 RepID=UPI0025DCC519|nr:energy transducer TonB [Erythrobacter sp.]MCM0000127.1 energy transducer TonB [Erythrobacter sp.]
MRRTFLALAALAASAAPAFAAPTIATPVAPWEASFEGGICRMQRAFETSGQPHLLILEQNAPSRALGIALAGPSLGGLDENAPLRVTLAASDAGFEKRARIDPNRQFGHVAILNGVWLADDVSEEGGNFGRIDLDAAQFVQRISVSQGGKDVIFDTGPLADAALVLNECTAQMLRSWGLDPDQQYTLQQRAQPVDPAKLAKEMQKSYPRGAARGLRSGPLEVVALIDAKGGVRECRIIAASQWADLDAATCTTLTKARYVPARDAEGRPVASYWRTRVTFLATPRDADRLLD